MAGVADLVAALTGGQGIEQQSYDATMKRLMAARDAQASMDKKMMEAAILRDQLRSRQNAHNLRGDMDPLAFEAMMAGFADQLKYSQESIGIGQQNTAREKALEIALALKADPATRQNALTSVAGDKLQTATNVNVGPQSQANFAKTVAETLAATELAGQRGAAAAKSRSEIATTPEGQVIPNLESIPSQYNSMLWQDPATIPVDVDNPYWFTGSTTMDLPLTDPRAAKVWAEMDNAEKDALSTYLGPEFVAWRTANILKDPSLQDADIAIGKFLEFKKGNSGKAAQDARNNRTVYATPDEVQADLAAGVLKSGDIIQTPDGPRVVK